MRYQVIVNRLRDGRYAARCDAGADGLIETAGSSRAAAVARLEKELRYRLELCPCSRSAGEYLRLDVREVQAPISHSGSAAARYPP